MRKNENSVSGSTTVEVLFSDNIIDSIRILLELDVDACFRAEKFAVCEYI